MSKSLGNVLDPFEAIDEFGTDALRFYLMREVAVRQDGTSGSTASSARYEHRARQRVRQPRQPHDRDDRSLPRRRRAGQVATDPELAAEFDGLAQQVAELFDRAELTPGARPDLAAGAAPEPLRRGARSRGSSPATEPRPPQLEQVLATLYEGLRAVTRAAGTLHAGRAPSGCSRRWARLDRLDAAAFAPPTALTGASRRCRRCSRSAHGAVIDCHTHLHSCEPPDDELVAAAREAGVTRIVTVGTDAENSRAGARRRRALPGGVRRRRPPPERGDRLRRRATTPSSSASRATRAASRSARPGSTTTASTRRTTIRRGPSGRRSRSRARLGKPLVIHTREADDDTLAILDEHAKGLKVILHCFSMADRVDECLAHPDWWFSFAGNVTYPKNGDLRAAALKVPAEPLLVETDAPYLSPQPVRGKRNVPANVVQTAQALALERRVSYHDFEREVEAAAAAVFGW